MGRPTLDGTSGRCPPVTGVLPKEMYDEFMALARRTGMSASALVRACVRLGLEKGARIDEYS